MRRALARFLLGLVLRLEGVAERLDPQGYPKTIDVERRTENIGGYPGGELGSEEAPIGLPPVVPGP